MASRRRLQQQDGADSTLTPIVVGGCSQTNYNVGVKVGDQDMVLILDSGSGDLAVASTACDTSCQDVPDQWDASQTGDTNKQAALSYGTAQIQGEVYKVAVAVPGEPAVDVNILAITDQAGLLNVRDR